MFLYRDPVTPQRCVSFCSNVPSGGLILHLSWCPGIEYEHLNKTFLTNLIGTGSLYGYKVDLLWSKPYLYYKKGPLCLNTWPPHNLIPECMRACGGKTLCPSVREATKKREVADPPTTGLPCKSFVETLVKWSAGQRAVTVYAPLPTWITYIDGNKI